MEKLLSSRQVCDTLSISPVTLWRYVRRGVCPPPRKLPNGHNRWHESEIKNLVASLEIADAYRDCGHTGEVA